MISRYSVWVLYVSFPPKHQLTAVFDQPQQTHHQTIPSYMYQQDDNKYEQNGGQSLPDSHWNIRHVCFLASSDSVVSVCNIDVYIDMTSQGTNISKFNKLIISILNQSLFRYLKKYIKMNKRRYIKPQDTMLASLRLAWADQQTDREES